MRTYIDKNGKYTYMNTFKDPKFSDAYVKDYHGRLL